MARLKSLKCRECGETYPLEPMNVCELCFGPLEIEYDYEEIARLVSREQIAAGPDTIWRYKDLLPIEGDKVVDMGAGFTPLRKADRLGEELGLQELYIKNDTVNPTWSFKDRVVSVATSKALEFGFDTMACASTGNLGNAVSAHAAKAGLRAFVFIPSDLETPKILLSSVYRPNVVAVNGTYDEVNRLCSELADRYPWAFVNINIRPYYTEGSKTLAYEVVEQLGWQSPDHIVIPIASGALLTKTWRGLNELVQVGLMDEITCRVHGAQPEGCSPVATAFKQGADDFIPVRPHTIARSLAIGNPADGFYALRAIRESGGVADLVSDEEIVEGILLLSRTEGIFAETAGGVTVGVAKKLAEAGIIKPSDRTVLLITGGGLKTQEVVSHKVPEPYAVQPNLKSFEETVGTATGQ